VQELLDAGYISDESAATHPQRHIITRALGVGPRPEADVVLLPVVPGEQFLACSDGLTGELTDQRIAELLPGDGDLEAVAEDLVAEVVDIGARDNTTVVVVRGPSGTHRDQ
jgi:protein phosphatase